MVEQEPDYVMRIVRRMVQAIINLIVGRAAVDDAEVEAACESLAGLSIETGAAVDLSSLTRLLSGPGGLEAERSLMMGLGLIFRGLRMARGPVSPQTRDRAKGVVDRGQTLLLLAVQADPKLLSEPVADLMQRLFANEAAH